MSGYRGNNFPINNQSYLCLARESLQKYGNAMNLIFFPVQLFVFFFCWCGQLSVFGHTSILLARFKWCMSTWLLCCCCLTWQPTQKHVNWCFWFSIFALNTFYFFRSFWVNERPRKISFCTRLFCCFHFAYRMFRSCIN